MPDGDADRDIDALLERALNDPTVHGVRITEKSLSGGEWRREVTILTNAGAVNKLLEADQQTKMKKLGLLYLVVIGIFVLAVIFIAAGLGLVALGATGTTQVDIFGSKISSTNVGIVSIFLGAVVVLVLIRKVIGLLKN